MKDEENYRCKSCIHIREAHMRDDGICMPQMFSPSEPRTIYENKTCLFYEEAPKERIVNGPFGIKTKEEWNPDKGDYFPVRKPSNVKTCTTLSHEYKLLCDRYEKGEITFVDLLLSGINFE